MEICPREFCLGKDRSLQVGVAEICAFSGRSSEGRVEEVLAMKITTALVGQGVIHALLEQGSILEPHTGGGIESDDREWQRCHDRQQNHREQGAQNLVAHDGCIES